MTKEEKAQKHRDHMRLYMREYNKDHDRKQRNAERARLWYEENKERAKEMRTRIPKDAQRAASRRYYEKNKEKISQQHSEWRTLHGKESRERNRAKINERARLRKSLQKNSTPVWYERDQVEMMYARCAALNKDLALTGDDQLEVDHIIPLNSKTVCGLHCIANLQLLSRSENRKKGNRYETDW